MASNDPPPLSEAISDLEDKVSRLTTQMGLEDMSLAVLRNLKALANDQERAMPELDHFEDAAVQRKQNLQNAIELNTVQQQTLQRQLDQRAFPLEIPAEPEVPAPPTAVYDFKNCLPSSTEPISVRLQSYLNQAAMRGYSHNQMKTNIRQALTPFEITHLDMLSTTMSLKELIQCLLTAFDLPGGYAAALETRLSEFVRRKCDTFKQAYHRLQVLLNLLQRHSYRFPTQDTVVAVQLLALDRLISPSCKAKLEAHRDLLIFQGNHFPLNKQVQYITEVELDPAMRPSGDLFLYPTNTPSTRVFPALRAERGTSDIRKDNRLQWEQRRERSRERSLQRARPYDREASPRHQRSTSAGRQYSYSPTRSTTPTPPPSADLRPTYTGAHQPMDTSSAPRPNHHTGTSTHRRPQSTSPVRYNIRDSPRPIHQGRSRSPDTRPPYSRNPSEPRFPRPFMRNTYQFNPRDRSPTPYPTNTNTTAKTPFTRTPSTRPFSPARQPTARAGSPAVVIEQASVMQNFTSDPNYRTIMLCNVCDKFPSKCFCPHGPKRQR